MKSEQTQRKGLSPHDSDGAAKLTEAELTLPQKTDLPLAEDPIAQVAVPATINGTSPLDPSDGPIPPKHHAPLDTGKRPDRSSRAQPQALRE